jgi:hypothetical protein
MSYTINSIEYPAVTTIIGQLDKSAGLIPWAVNSTCQWIEENYDPEQPLEEQLQIAKKEYKNVSKEALDIGSEIHDLIEKYIKHGRDAIGELRDEVQNGFLAFLDWEEKNIDCWIESEMSVVDTNYGYAGTLDATAIFKDGRKMVIDFKSSKGFYDGYGMQVASYGYARQSMSGEYNIKSRFGEYKINCKQQDFDGCGVLRLDKATGIPEFKDYSKVMEQKYNAFLLLTKFYYCFKKRRLKGNNLAVEYFK